MIRSVCLSAASMLLACSNAGDAARSPTPVELAPERAEPAAVEPPAAPPSVPELAPEAPAEDAPAEPSNAVEESDIPSPPPPPAIGFSVPSRPELVQPLLDRWSAATCLELTLSDNGPHSVLFTTDGFSARNRLGQTTGTWDAATIRIRPVQVEAQLPLDTQMSIVLMHELAHLLALTNDHVDNSVMSADDGFAARNLNISADLLNVVCERRDCGCFQPE